MGHKTIKTKKEKELCKNRPNMCGLQARPHLSQSESKKFPLVRKSRLQFYVSEIASIANRRKGA